MFLKQMCVSCIDERSGEEGSEMRSSVFLRRMEHLDRCHLSVLDSASRGFQELYSSSEPATGIPNGLKE